MRHGKHALISGMLGCAVWLLAAGCSPQIQPSGPTQASAPPTTVPNTAAPSASSPVSSSPVPAGGSPSAAPAKPAAVTASPSAAASAGKWNFDADPVGGVPAGAQVLSGRWAVRAE